MLSVRDIVQAINTKLETVFVSGFKTYGVARTVTRGADTLPVVDETTIVPDDIYAMQLYHKIIGLTMTQRPGTGFGDDTPYNVNTYQMQMIVFNNQPRTKMNADELALLIQSAFPKILKSENFISVRNFLTNVILNSQQVYAQEYKSDTYRLFEQNMFQINYNLEIVFKTNCLVLCPEDFCTIKN